MDSNTHSLRDKRRTIAQSIGIDMALTAEAPSYTVHETVYEEGYTRQRITYASNGATVPAYLLIPDTPGPHPAVLVHHQHNSERHLGKSEVCGLAGHPCQAFGPALARGGCIVLAPDAACFEERRIGGRGIEPLPGDGDFLQHYNAMCYAILKGETLMKRVIGDAINAVSLLLSMDSVDKDRLGTLGHSFGGNTVLFLSALDERIAFACASGSACTYANRISNNVGIEMASVIPGFFLHFDIDDLLSCAAPRDMLIVSAEGDKYSRDAPYTVSIARRAYEAAGASGKLHHKRYAGGHALDGERFTYIIEWMLSAARLDAE